MTTNNNVIDLATHRNIRKGIIHVNPEACARVAKEVAHIVGETPQVFVARIVRAYLDEVK